MSDSITPTFISVTERLPEPHKLQKHICLTEEGNVLFLTYNPPFNANDAQWWDDREDSGHVIGWMDATAIYEAKDFARLHNLWREKLEDDW